MASARPKQACVVPGCTNKAKHPLCERCFARLPGELRVGIMEAHHQRRFADLAQLKRSAGEYLNLVPVKLANARSPYRPRISPQRSAALISRMLGERPEL